MTDTAKYYFQKNQEHFLRQVLVNDNNRTPISQAVRSIITVTLKRGWYEDINKKTLNWVLDNYKDHVWGTKI